MQASQPAIPPTYLNIRPCPHLKKKAKKWCVVVRVEFHGRFSVLHAQSWVNEAPELEGPTNQNGQIPEFTHWLNQFALKLWSFRCRGFWNALSNRERLLRFSFLFYQTMGVILLKWIDFMKLSFSQREKSWNMSFGIRKSWLPWSFPSGNERRVQNRCMCWKPSVLRIRLESVLFGHLSVALRT